MVITTSSELLQVPFVIVHLKVADVVTPVTVVVGLVGMVIVAVPLTTFHIPEPTVGEFAAIVKEVLLQFSISVPALAVVAVS